MSIFYQVCIGIAAWMAAGIILAAAWSLYRNVQKEVWRMSANKRLAERYRLDVIAWENAAERNYRAGDKSRGDACYAMAKWCNLKRREHENSNSQNDGKSGGHSRVDFFGERESGARVGGVGSVVDVGKRGGGVAESASEDEAPRSGGTQAGSQVGESGKKG